MTRKLDYLAFDADNHMYEATDAFTKYLPKEYEGVIKYVEVNGRTKIAIKNKISDYIPNPTFNVVAPPGAQELEFKLKNPDSMTKADREAQLTPPPRYIPSPPAFFQPEDRVMLMDEQGIDRAMMWPTLASLLEERLTDDPVATHVVVHGLNQWMHEQWTFNFENRIFPTPVITLPIVDQAIAELEWVVERGAKAILVRPAPVPDFNGRRRSFALPEFDPFWEKVVEADVVVGMHASDSGFQRYVNEWEGHVDKFQKVYSRVPKAFDEDPMEAFKRCIYVHPFHEEDPLGLVKLIGADNVLFGSDFPHPEGMYDPIGFVDQLEGLTEDDKAKVMGGNLNRIMKVPALV